MITRVHLTRRSLSLQGPCAFVPVATITMSTMNKQHAAASLGDAYGMHPGKGGA